MPRILSLLCRLTMLRWRRLSPLFLLGLCSLYAGPPVPWGPPAADPPATLPSATQPSGARLAGDRAELLSPISQTRPAPQFDATESYTLQTIEGWPVRVNQRLPKEQPELAAQTMDVLRFQLFQITRAVPAPALARLQTVQIWVEQSDPLVRCMCYHPSRAWVTGHGLNPAKAHGVELGNARTFLNWTHDQPWMVLHELAHAYHDQFLPHGFENPQVLAAYEAAKHAGLYNSVLRSNGRTERAYAMTNPMEYFAECSEAFFGTNDFYPFVRAELKAHDPAGFAMLAEAWEAGNAPKKAPVDLTTKAANPK